VEPVFDGVRAVLYGPVHLGVDWHIDGLERIPHTGAVILASNHVSYLDPIVLAYVATKRGRRTRFLAKEELFAKRGLGPVLRGLRQIPVARGTSSAAGSLVVAEAGKTGTARLAAATGAPVVPVGLWGLHRVMFKGRKPHWRVGVPETVAIGAPLTVEPADDVQAATDRVMAAICAQVAAARTAYPERPAAGEDGWWERSPDTAVLRSCR
jgi:1-acyl-sn-glycerol-3-phosphate acyltransferase